ncbi:alpha-L-arabinofuranosidase II [Fusarium sp. NRRL 25303]|nr:alpha-L-arabinofuranosidase II [Fusarium sp. NRRL 25303]
MKSLVYSRALLGMIYAAGVEAFQNPVRNPGPDPSLIFADGFDYVSVMFTFSAPANSVVALTVLLGFYEVANAAVQCDLTSSVHCGRNHHKQNQKDIMNAKLQSITQSIPDFSSHNDNFDLTYNFNLGDCSGTYWVILPTSFGGGDACHAVYKNCDRTISFWEKSQPLPTYYHQLA